MPGTPRITVVTPNFRHARYLEETIRSVVEQGYPNLEYFVVDGGSTDGSVDVIRKWERRIDWWVSERDRGHFDAIDKGLRRATGDVCAWISSTDLYLPGTLRIVGEFFAGHPGVDVVYGHALHLDDRGRLLRTVRQTEMSWRSLVFERLFLTQEAVFWRRGLYERVGGIDPSYKVIFDHDLIIRMLRTGRARCLPKFLAAVRLHGDAIHAQQRSRALEELERLEGGYQEGMTAREIVRNRLWCFAERTASWLLHGNPWIALWNVCDALCRSRALGNAPVLRGPARVMRALLRPSAQ